MSDVAKRLGRVFQQALAEFLESPALARVRTGDFTPDHYKSFLREVYYYTRENPQLQAAATAHFRGHDRTMVRGFLRHAASEIGHDQLALDDIKALGGDTAEIPFQNPLPATVAMTAFSYWTMQLRNPISYLGWIYFLEHMPTTAGDGFVASLERVGVPRSAMTFIADHVSIDQAHIRLMDDYVNKLLRTEQDVADVTYAIQATATLYGAMVDAAFRRVDHPGKYDFGADLGEAARRDIPSALAAE